jgi:MFS superfamily sulfate permease-like transporter
MNKPIIKNKLEEVPEDSYVLIDASRADFIDKDIVDVIEDFMIHAPLKNIRVDLKRSSFKEQGFNKMLQVKTKEHHHLIRKPETTLAEVED